MEKKTFIQNKQNSQQNRSDWSEGDDRHWPALARDEADRGDGQYNTLEGR